MIIEKTKNKYILLYFGLFLVFVSGIIYLTDNLSNFQLPTLILGLFIMLLICLKKGMLIPRTKYFVVHLFLAFICFCS